MAAPPPSMPARGGRFQEVRRCLRSTQLRQHAEAGDTGFLAARSVTATTAHRYKEAFRNFTHSVGEAPVRWEDQEAVDQAMSRYLDGMYFDGLDVAFGQVAVAALQFFKARFAKHGDLNLPDSFRALKGWERLVPPQTRRPVPLEMILAIAVMMKEHFSVIHAAAVLTMFAGYLRPMEALTLRHKDLFFTDLPVGQVIVKAEETGDLDKTEITDKVEDLACSIPWLPRVLHQIHKPGNGALLFPISYEKLRTAMITIVEALGIPPVVLYQLRHSGPSIDLRLKHRTPEAVRMKVRWISTRSFGRYAQPGTPALQRYALPPRCQPWLRQVKSHAEGFLLGLITVPAFPEKRAS